ncbi:hypothetical protein NHQ30_000855 [Ciborinia camelliae]|nr:hypothetical protein NHQ30_000855 [Ciborinia camelliae]
MSDRPKRSPKRTKFNTSTETLTLPTMANLSGGPHFWSPDADETQNAYNELAGGTNIDTNAIDTNLDHSWFEQASFQSDLPQITPDFSADSVQNQPDTSYSEGFDYSGVYAGNYLSPLLSLPWHNWNGTLSLPGLDNLDIFSEHLLGDLSNNVDYPMLPPDLSMDPTFQPTNFELLDINAPWNPPQATFDHANTQAYGIYPQVSNTQSSILDNFDSDSMNSSLNMNSPPGTNLPLMSSPTQSLTTNTNTSNSISQSTSYSNSAIPSSDRSTLNSPPIVQNEYTCTICSKTFSKRFELKYGPYLLPPSLQSLQLTTNTH